MLAWSPHYGLLLPYHRSLCRGIVRFGGWNSLGLLSHAGTCYCTLVLVCLFDNSGESINVMNVSSGDDTTPLPETHELRGRLTHPANINLRSEILISMDRVSKRLRQWSLYLQSSVRNILLASVMSAKTGLLRCVTLVLTILVIWCDVQLTGQLFYQPINRREAILDANLSYMSETLMLEADAFYKVCTRHH
jgi:hypothetical protein